jgi:putative (di)nucleoside polyphosphate hydrolase
MVVLGPEKRVLAIERSKTPGAWQLPQGGLHDGETPLEAAYRELEEETGLLSGYVALVAEHPGWLAYELPEAYRSAKTGLGQCQKWFLFRYDGEDSRVRLALGGEARAWAWLDLRDLTASIVEFRRPMYEAVERWVAGNRAAGLPPGRRNSW